MVSANGRGPLPSGFADIEVRYPVALVNRRDVEAMLTGPYDLQARFVEERGAHVVGRQTFDHTGYLAKRIRM